MGLFIKKPDVTNNQFYSIGLNKSVLIVGLGNIGKEYESTRHNVGFTCIEAFAKTNNFPEWINKKDLKCSITQATLGDTRVMLIKPSTFMNASGEAIETTIDFYKIPANLVLVVHDELDINFGQIRARAGGSDAGHNGVKSIIEHIGEDFGRIRVGIGPKVPPQIDSTVYVLQKFTSEELENMPALTREVSAMLSEYVYGEHVVPNDTRTYLL